MQVDCQALSYGQDRESGVCMSLGSGCRRAVAGPSWPAATRVPRAARGLYFWREPSARLSGSAMGKSCRPRSLSSTRWASTVLMASWAWLRSNMTGQASPAVGRCATWVASWNLQKDRISVKRWQASERPTLALAFRLPHLERDLFWRRRDPRALLRAVVCAARAALKRRLRGCS